MQKSSQVTQNVYYNKNDKKKNTNIFTCNKTILNLCPMIRYSIIVKNSFQTRLSERLLMAIGPPPLDMQGEQKSLSKV